MPVRSNKIFLCQCHDVTLADVTRCWNQGMQHPEAIKRVTGITMGGCQGKLCLTLFSEILQALSGEPWPATRMPVVRPPLYPIRMGALAGSAKRENSPPEGP